MQCKQVNVIHHALTVFRILLGTVCFEIRLIMTGCHQMLIEILLLVIRKEFNSRFLCNDCVRTQLSLGKLTKTITTNWERKCVKTSVVFDRLSAFRTQRIRWQKRALYKRQILCWYNRFHGHLHWQLWFQSGIIINYFKANVLPLNVDKKNRNFREVFKKLFQIY